jgi:asparagine synthase (glutamine-hydrolysing)
MEKEGIWSAEEFKDQDKYESVTTEYRSSEKWVSLRLAGKARITCHVWSGLTTVGQLYYRHNENSFVVSSDLRLLIRKRSDSFDPAGFYSLFQFGSVSAPFTLFKTIKRVPPGHLCSFSGGRIQSRLMPHRLTQCQEYLPPVRQPESLMEHVLKDQLSKIPAEFGIFFSGGVDSGLLAALAKQLRRSEIILINCDFSSCLQSTPDQEAALARDMAVHLGYRLEVVGFDAASVRGMFERLGKDYTFPFGDYSTIPTNILVHHAAALLKPGSWILDGTGADGIFLNTSSWTTLKRIYVIPLFIRRCLARAFQCAAIFNGSGYLTRYLGYLHQSQRVPARQAQVMTQSRLADIGFLADWDSVLKITKAQELYLQSAFKELDEGTQLSLMDLVHVCAGIYVSKDCDPLRRRGMVPFFPFLSEDVIRAGLFLMENLREERETKLILKRLLSKHVPNEMVYRAKSGFAPPIEVTLNSRAAKEYINDIVLSRDNPLEQFVYPRVVTKMFQRLWSGKPVYGNHFNFLWSYIFVSVWFNQQLSFCSSLHEGT